MIPLKSPGVDSLAEGLVVLAESTTTGLAAVDDPLIKADCCKMKEATNAITRADAPHSAIAKLRRDMDFNIIEPIEVPRDQQQEHEVIPRQATAPTFRIQHRQEGNG